MSVGDIGCVRTYVCVCVGACGSLHAGKIAFITEYPTFARTYISLAYVLHAQLDIDW